jgi:hypothetical protein
MKKFAIFIVLLLFSAGFIIVWLSLSTGTIRIINDFSNATENLKQTTKYTDQKFMIYKLKYYNSSLINEYFNNSNKTLDICNNSKTKEIIIIDIITYNYNLPFECKFFIDNKLILTKLINKIPCENYCEDQESIFTIDLGSHNFYNDYEINVCCNNNCNKEILNKLC